jgi:hypothetical protein
MSSLSEIYQEKQEKRNDHIIEIRQVDYEGIIGTWFESVVSHISAGDYDDDIKRCTRGIEDSDRTIYRLSYYPKTENDVFGDCGLDWHDVVKYLDGKFGLKYSRTIKKSGSLVNGCRIFLETRYDCDNFALIAFSEARYQVGYQLAIDVAPKGWCVIS